MNCFLGLDIGTSATKAILIDSEGVVLGVTEAEHAIDRPRPGWSEQDPAWWWVAVCEAIAGILPAAGVEASDIAAVGMSGQMHGSVFLPAHATAEEPDVIRPALLWNDQRTAKQCDAIEHAAGGRDRLIQLVGNPALTGLTAPKILWLREHEPDHFAAVRHIVLPKDYILFRLTRQLVSDVGDASGTLLLDPATRRWSDELLAALELHPSLLPDVVESQEVIGKVSAWAARATGLIEGTPVIAGSGDQMTGAVGAGIVTPGIVSATLGTSGVVFAHAGNDLPRDPTGSVQVMCAAVPGEYCIYGCMLSAAGALHWFRDALAPGVPFADLDNEAADISTGSGGLIFLPYLTGERCPHPDPAARGMWVGLTSRHTRGHLTRSVLEGVAMGMGEVLDLIRSLGVEPHEVRMSGGGANSDLWRAIHANIFGVPVTTQNTSEGSAYGAAILAGVGAGAWPDVSTACRSVLSQKSRNEPDPTSVERYAKARAVFASLYPALQPAFADLAALDQV